VVFKAQPVLIVEVYKIVYPKKTYGTI